MVKSPRRSWEFAAGTFLPRSQGHHHKVHSPRPQPPFCSPFPQEPIFVPSQDAYILFLMHHCLRHSSCRLGIHFPSPLLNSLLVFVCFNLFSVFCAIADLQAIFRGGTAARMDFSGTQGELPMAMHGGGGSPFLGLHHEHEQQYQHHRGANGRHVSPPEAPEEEKNRQALAMVPVSSGGGGGGGVRYRECLKNHAAAIGGSATDGCGEFMPAGEEGSLDALRCSACGCHRNFHRKEPPGGGDGVGGGRPLHLGHHHPLSPLHHPHQRGLLVAALPPAPTRMVMPLSAAMHQHHAAGAATSAESDDARGAGSGAPSPARKRFRTKFTAEQKARMLGFAEEAGWRLQKLEDAAVQRFCQEVGVKRRVLKVWMHNNKHTLARRHQPPASGDLPEPGRSPSRSPPQLRLE